MDCGSREYFSIRYFVFGTGIRKKKKKPDKKRDNARNRDPYAASEITSKYFAIQANISRCVSLFSLSSIPASARILVPVRPWRDSRSRHIPGADACDRVGIPVMSVNARFPTSKNVRALLYVARRPYSYSRHSSIRQTDWRSIQAFFRPKITAYTRFLYICERGENVPRSPVFKITRAHTTPGGGEGGDIFLSGD